MGSLLGGMFHCTHMAPIPSVCYLLSCSNADKCHSCRLGGLVLPSSSVALQHPCHLLLYFCSTQKHCSISLLTDLFV
jgi:hypothetical protein